MPREGVPGFLKIRVLDNNTGVVLIPDLPHTPAATYTVRALQGGIPNASVIGDFTIPLFTPDSDAFRRNREVLLKLAVGQRVEMFRGDVLTGIPVFSGVITKIRRQLDGLWEVSGSDSLWLLQQSQAFQSEQILAPFPAKFSYDVYRATREVVWDDDFSGSFPGSNYTNNGWVSTTDPYFGQPAVYSTAQSPTIAWMVTNQTWGNNSQYAPCEITIQGSLVGGTADAEASIFLLGDNAQTGSGYLVRADLLPSGSAWNVSCQIWTIVAGTYTKVAWNDTAFTNVNQVFTFELSAVIYQYGTSRVIVNRLNGKGTCNWPTTSLVASGGIGLRCSPAAGGSPATYVNRLRFLSRPGNWGTNRFGVGNAASSTVNVQNTVVVNGQTHLDMLMLASETDGYWIRKNPGYGYKSDTLDYAVSPGSDLSSSIIFEEGDNVLKAEIAPVSELYATDVRVNGIPDSAIAGGDSGGSFTWSQVQPVGNMALIDTVSDLGIPGYGLLRAYAFKTGARKANPIQATQLTVLRTPETMDKWRELDYVTTHCPTVGVYRRKQQVIGYTFTEGDPTQTVYLDQFPDHALVRAGIQRVLRPIEGLWNTYQVR